jgi:hypothetical protein
VGMRRGPLCCGSCCAPVAPTSMVPFSRTNRHQCVGSARKGAGSRSAGGWLLLRDSSLQGLKRDPESPYSISSSSSTVGLGIHRHVTVGHRDPSPSHPGPHILSVQAQAFSFRATATAQLITGPTQAALGGEHSTDISVQAECDDLRLLWGEG